MDDLTMSDRLQRDLADTQAVLRAVVSDAARLRAALAEAKKCTVCGEPTGLACSDCRIDFQTAIYVCKNPKCRDEHELKCSAMVRTALAEAEQKLTSLRPSVAEIERDEAIARLAKAERERDEARAMADEMTPKWAAAVDRAERAEAALATMQPPQEAERCTESGRGANDAQTDDRG